VPRLRLLAVLALLPALAVAEHAGPRGEGDGSTTMSDDSRWLSFTRLIEARWRIRTEVVGADETVNRRLYAQCVDDAWYLALPNLLSDEKTPCGQLVSALPTSARTRRRNGPTRDELRAKYVPSGLAPNRNRYLTCTAEAAGRADPELLAVCGLALKPKASVLASLTDDDRFGGWLGGCKRAMLGDLRKPAADSGARAVAKPGEKAPPESPARPLPHTPAEDDQARHCLRVLPTLYEVQWLRKLSDFWTPEELRALHLRTQQLGQN
jgi:hypothetical protein